MSISRLNAAISPVHPVVRSGKEPYKTPLERVLEIKATEDAAAETREAAKAVLSNSSATVFLLGQNQVAHVTAPSVVAQAYQKVRDL